jgi:hypothetical protein
MVCTGARSRTSSPLPLPMAPEHQHPGGDQQQDQGSKADRLRLPGRGLLFPQDPCGLSR